VRRLRTTHRKFSRSGSTVCAFAPPEKRLSSALDALSSALDALSSALDALSSV